MAYASKDDGKWNNLDIYTSDELSKILFKFFFHTFIPI